MPAIWRNDGSTWRLLSSDGFPDEATLHKLIEDAPQILPLAGNPRLTVLGKEVLLGSGYADLIAVEADGRLTVIEIKLAQNAEVRRAVVSQVLAYAAFLYRMSQEVLEHDVLAKHLAPRSLTSIADAVAAEDQSGSFDSAQFRRNLADCLSNGAFRLVLVLDQAPDELSRLVGYFAGIAPAVTIDLINVEAYSVEGSQIVIPQRVDPEQFRTEWRPRSTTSVDEASYSDGSDAFAAGIEKTTAANPSSLRTYLEWARELERAGLARLRTTMGKGRSNLNVWLMDENVGLVSIWNEPKWGSIAFWATALQRRAPHALERLRELSPVLAAMKSSNSIRDVEPAILATVRAAYVEAAKGEVTEAFNG
jgi:hypothetical protein